MAKRLRLTIRAQRRLTEIAEWTRERFGPGQARGYVAGFRAAFEGLAEGTLPTRSARVAWGEELPDDLRFVRVGSHVLLLRDRPDEVVVTDVLHGAMDLPRKVKG